MILIHIRFRSFFEVSGTVAQSVEQRTENPRVGGSIPSRPTTLISKSSNAYEFFYKYFFLFNFRLISLQKVQTDTRFELIYRYFKHAICTKSVQNRF